LPLDFLASFVRMRKSSSRVFALALAAGVVLSACSSTDRSAAPAEEVVATDQVTESVEQLASESEPVIDADQDLAPAESNSPPNLAEIDDDELAGSDTDIFLDTRLQITNKTGKNQMIKLGAGCIDPSGLFGQTLAAGATIAVSGWCGLKDSDIAGAFGVKVSSGIVVDDYSWFQITAGNPKGGWPWINIDGVKHRFSSGESCVFTRQDQKFEALRAPDLSGAKDLQLTWVTSSTLPAC
jgi:hypothetical protein